MKIFLYACYIKNKLKFFTSNIRMYAKNFSLTKSYLNSINLFIKKTFSFLRTAKNPVPIIS